MWRCKRVEMQACEDAAFMLAGWSSLLSNIQNAWRGLDSGSDCIYHPAVMGQTWLPIQVNQGGAAGSSRNVSGPAGNRVPLMQAFH